MGVADLMIVIPLLIVGVFFLGDIAQIGTSREKLSFILGQAANYAVNLAPDVDPAVQTTQLTELLCIRNNLRVSKLNIKVEQITVSGCDAISVKASADIPLLAGSILPGMSHVEDVATALVPANRVCATVAINPYPFSTDNPTAGASIYVPVIQPKSGVPVWQFPYDAAINNLHVVEGVTPAAPSIKDPYFAERPSLY
jgi:hypothetical protein